MKRTKIAFLKSFGATLGHLVPSGAKWLKNFISNFEPKKMWRHLEPLGLKSINLTETITKSSLINVKKYENIQKNSITDLKCLNDGYKDKDGNFCICPEGFEGENCEIQIFEYFDICYSECQNGVNLFINTAVVFHQVQHIYFIYEQPRNFFFFLIFTSKNGNGKF